ncbi:MAG: 2-C-methyl-D-erythritol 4-phosphate cytidylyltransferase [Eubacteriales bacterium]|nr:2-C-methyl-D-erythritol 4-phosphate cytidylyltransferase [Eubacteriales bacterium]
MKGHHTAIVLAAGRGKRMNSAVQKQFLEIKGKPILYYSLKCMEETEQVTDVILVTSEDMLSYCREEIVTRYGFQKVKKIIAGGKERYDSVYAGLCACDPGTEYVLIHDAARPFVTPEIINRGLVCAYEKGACVAGVPSKDTVKLSDSRGMVTETPNRESVWIVQTPQTFRYDLIKNAHEVIRRGDMSKVTDDAMVVEQAGGQSVALVMGSYQNIKITTPEDLLVAEAFLSMRQS